MLRIHRPGTSQPITWQTGDPIAEDAVWLDLLDPTPAERDAVETLAGVPLAERDAISSLGLSSSYRHDKQTLTLHMHMYADHPDGRMAPVGMLVTRTRLITQHYQPVRAWGALDTYLAHGQRSTDGPALLVHLLHAIADDIADQMQSDAADVAGLSGDVFEEAREKTRELRRKLVRVGKVEAKLARYRTSMLGVRRLVTFVQHRSPDWIDEQPMDSLGMLTEDLKVLDEFDEQLTGKLQFLQDAVLGFINTDQNAVMKLLTVASVVTIPPVILAGIWGMNFKHMPELDEVWGYPMALSLIVLSMLGPLAWFGLRGWLSRD
ncbi:CorA family divalent cation transporter [Dyella sp.]|jgi:magnesium transporter|uniref:CorA family divalent cation transporter n=1 Tax=Dyella sp. TaxID=1869338 RepID=UPI002D790C70|nr:CorA family divalent cation transporter [Dyella sp.]HET6432705.1 CorA family divalent cation transporter [Dyella sp.]